MAGARAHGRLSTKCFSSNRDEKGAGEWSIDYHNVAATTIRNEYM